MFLCLAHSVNSGLNSTCYITSGNWYIKKLNCELIWQTNNHIYIMFTELWKDRNCVGAKRTVVLHALLITCFLPFILGIFCQEVFFVSRNESEMWNIGVHWCPVVRMFSLSIVLLSNWFWWFTNKIFWWNNRSRVNSLTVCSSWLRLPSLGECLLCASLHGLRQDSVEM